MPKYELESEQFAFAEKEYEQSKRTPMKNFNEKLDKFLSDTGDKPTPETDRIILEDRMEDVC